MYCLYERNATATPEFRVYQTKDKRMINGWAHSLMCPCELNLSPEEENQRITKLVNSIRANLKRNKEIQHG